MAEPEPDTADLYRELEAARLREDELRAETHAACRAVAEREEELETWAGELETQQEAIAARAAELEQEQAALVERHTEIVAEYARVQELASHADATSGQAPGG